MISKEVLHFRSRIVMCTSLVVFSQTECYLVPVSVQPNRVDFCQASFRISVSFQSKFEKLSVVISKRVLHISIINI